jgi:periplasmic protein TonB
MSSKTHSKSTTRTQNVEHGWTLARWFGIPIALVAALYFVQRAYDEQPFVVVTDRGAMPSPDQIAAAPRTTPAALATGSPAPLVPVAPPISDPIAPATLSDAAPQALSQPSPPYPQRALEAEKEGVVRLHLTITPDGRVSDAVVISAEPPGWFDRAAEEGVRRWLYAPSAQGGTTEVDVEFKLK